MVVNQKNNMATKKVVDPIADEEVEDEDVEDEEDKDEKDSDGLGFGSLDEDDEDAWKDTGDSDEDEEE
ncbi:MAG: hypothetical protein A3B23_03750 [Candidatus Colwellbacteria bacterium RIFCSPLOWO2_01_FULL_48_10]|uniref:Uncharacterized protein n=2 Tax=Bacteria candidate phyla TaxID=1783234 RepID=A0A1F5P428_9BACT|nr:MAG: hypothetical protein A2846_02820 [Candidatus Doudnabacteria bacterium RIFCSPHIGHO2_01_FULL_49_9]OGY59376.1 MAG: hypothetical protein A3B23_03750 [Candidatus Colwellbacteria bacterium RIFCSPLOWO2_01_FULL_48_10]